MPASIWADLPAGKTSRRLREFFSLDLYEKGLGETCPFSLNVSSSWCLSSSVWPGLLYPPVLFVFVKAVI